MGPLRRARNPALLVGALCGCATNVPLAPVAVIDGGEARIDAATDAPALDAVEVADEGATTVRDAASAIDRAPSPDRAPTDSVVVVRDSGPRPSRFWWDTELIAPSRATRAVLGDGHVHSDFSGDGTHPALEMMNRAHALGADFVWITDHGRTPATPGGVSADEYDVCAARGRQATDASRFAGCGVEYRLGYTRADGSAVYEAWHQVVHGFDADQFGEVLNASGYTAWNAYERDLSRAGAYALLTHPSGPTAWYNDDDAAFRDTDPAHHPNTELIELNGGDDDPRNGSNLLDGINTYFRFLNDGWQVSPVWDSDMHRFYDGPERAKGYGAWVDADDWSAGRFRAALRASARAHNTFANHPGDERNALRVVSLAPDDGAPEAMMGSTLPARASLRLRAQARITDGRARWVFKLFTNAHDRFDDPLRAAGEAATTVSPGGGEQVWETAVNTAGVRWVVVYASTSGGPPDASTEFLVSAPFWLND